MPTSPAVARAELATALYSSTPAPKMPDAVAPEREDDQHPQADDPDDDLDADGDGRGVAGEERQQPRAAGRPTATAASIMMRSMTRATSGMRARARRAASRATTAGWPGGRPVRPELLGLVVPPSVLTLVRRRSLIIDMHCPPQAPGYVGRNGQRGLTFSSDPGQVSELVQSFTDVWSRSP